MELFSRLWSTQSRSALSVLDQTQLNAEKETGSCHLLLQQHRFDQTGQRRLPHLCLATPLPRPDPRRSLPGIQIHSQHVGRNVLCRRCRSNKAQSQGNRTHGSGGRRSSNSRRRRHDYSHYSIDKHTDNNNDFTKPQSIGTTTATQFLHTGCITILSRCVTVQLYLRSNHSRLSSWIGQGTHVPFL